MGTSSKELYRHRLQSQTLPNQADQHPPDETKEATQTDTIQDSNSPQTPPDTGSPTSRYKKTKFN